MSYMEHTFTAFFVVFLPAWSRGSIWARWASGRLSRYLPVSCWNLQPVIKTPLCWAIKHSWSTHRSGRTSCEKRRHLSICVWKKRIDDNLQDASIVTMLSASNPCLRRACMSSTRSKTWEVIRRPEGRKKGTLTGSFEAYNFFTSHVMLLWLQVIL